MKAMLKPGDKAPEFSLKDDQGRTVSLRDLLARGPVVLYFYPADFTPVCTKEACVMRDASPVATRAGVQVVGVSPQDVESKARFKAKHNLPFPLLADPGRQAIRAYGATGLFGLPVPGWVRRCTYLIGTDGVILDAVASDFGTSAHEALLRRAAERFGISRATSGSA